MKEIQVFKKNGGKENFDPQKIKRVVVAAGLTENEAEKLSIDVSKWMFEQRKKEFTSIEIRDRILTELMKVNKNIADFYRWYQKTRSQEEERNGNKI